MPDPEARGECLDALASEFAQRYRRGEQPTVSEYTAKHPELAKEIRELFPTIAAVERLRWQRDQSRGGRASLRGAHLERLGELRIIREIGRGGMGIVYEAEQESLGRRVAIKVLPRHALLDPLQLKRFEREARIAAGLQHPNIVAVHDVGQHDGFHYFVMQLIRGVGLDKIVARLADAGQCGVAGLETQTFVAVPTAGGPLSAKDPAYWKSVARIGWQAANALHYAHARGTLHCDIKPANLLVDPEGFLWIADFGVAKAVQFDKVTRTGDVTGTLQYIAPERFQGQTDARSDVYSLGMTLYELLTLRSPYSDGERESMVRRILEESPTAPRQLDPTIPPKLETIVLKAIERDLGQRYQSAGELADDLKRYLEDRPVEARRASWRTQSWRWCRRNPVTTGLAGAVAILATILVVLTARSQSPAQPSPSVEKRPVEVPPVVQRIDQPVDQPVESEKDGSEFRGPPTQRDAETESQRGPFEPVGGPPGEDEDPARLEWRDPPPPLPRDDPPDHRPPQLRGERRDRPPPPPDGERPDGPPPRPDGERSDGPPPRPEGDRPGGQPPDGQPPDGQPPDGPPPGPNGDRSGSDPPGPPGQQADSQ